jgi:general secretion pathway protein A
VLNRLLERVHASEGLVVLTAPRGFGKTTVCRAAARKLDRRTLQALVLEPPQSIEQLLQIVLVDFGVVSRADLAGAPQVKREALTATLASFVKSLAPLQANALIAIDDAHTIPEAVLTELRDVVAAVDSRLLQIVVAGEPELESMVERAGLRATGGDRGVVLELQPLAADEIEPYVRHRLQVVDNRTRVDFSPGAFARLYQFSRGVPRDINLLCERALIQGAAGSASVIDSGLVDRAAADLGRAIPGAAPPAMARRMVLLLVLTALMLVGAAAAAWVFRDAANRAFSQWLRVPPAPAGNLPGRPPI